MAHADGGQGDAPNPRVLVLFALVFAVLAVGHDALRRRPSQFTASIEGCTQGDTSSAGKAVFPPPNGVFVGYKLFDCNGGGETGFLVRLNARFSYSGGSVGSWTIVDAWGDFAGMTGSGKLVGIPIEGVNGITDNYFGVVTF